MAAQGASILGVAGSAVTKERSRKMPANLRRDWGQGWEEEEKKKDEHVTLK